MKTLADSPATVPLHLHIDLNEQGIGEFEDSGSAIARPYRRLLQEGADPGIISYILVRSSTNTPSRVLGTVCETPGNRLLFFPGCSGRVLRGHFNRQSRSAYRPLKGIIDHLTFDIFSCRGHMTEVRTSGRREAIIGLTRRRPEVAEKLYGWFGITIRSLDSLEIAPRRLWFVAECPASDVERRRALFQTVGTVSRVFSVEIPAVAPDYFIQVNFFVDLDPARNLQGIRSFLPNGPPVLTKAIKVPSTMKAEFHGMQTHGGSAMVKMHFIVWRGEPINNVGFGL